MTLKYGKKKALDTLTMNYDNCFDYHGLAWKLGKECFPYFCEIYLHNHLFDYSSGDKVPLSKKHLDIWDELQNDVLNRNNTKKCFIFPRSFGKSMTITIPIACWSALYCLHPFNVIDSATDNQAQNFINTIKMQIEDNQYITGSFGEVINKNLTYNATEIELDIKPQRSKIRCVSATSSVRGIIYGSYRVGLLILDDTQDEKLIRTEDARAEFVKRIDDGILKTMQNSNNHIIGLGTICFKDDLYDSFKNSLEWEVRIAKCIPLDNIDEYFKTNKHWLKYRDILKGKDTNPYAKDDAEKYYYDNKAEMDFPIIWENYNRMELASKYYANPVSFKQEYQGDIDNLGEKRITGCCRIKAKDIETKEYSKTILSVDPASTTGKKSDFSAFCVLSEEKDTHIKYCRKIEIEKLEFEDYINKIISLLEAYPDITTISIERNTFSGTDVKFLCEKLALHPLLGGKIYNFINKARTKNKDNRINAVIPEINLNRIIFNEDDTEALEQIEQFAGTDYTKNDDAIDALTDAYENIIEMKPPMPKLKLYNIADFGI